MFDSHAHLSSTEILPYIAEIVQRASLSNVTHMLNICTDAFTLQEGLLLQKKYPQILNAGATTPHDVETEGEKNFPLFENAARTKQLVAVGETGLDYHYKELNIQTQKQFLIRYLHLAAECNLPVIFHCREAFSDLFTITDLEYPPKAPAILHCFTGTLQEAEEVLKRNWYLSLSGIVTFKKSEALRAVAKMVPLSNLLIETDAPYLAPQSKRGKQNEPSFIRETGECIAREKGISPKEVFQTTSENAERLFLRSTQQNIKP